VGAQPLLILIPEVPPPQLDSGYATVVTYFLSAITSYYIVVILQ